MGVVILCQLHKLASLHPHQPKPNWLPRSPRAEFKTTLGTNRQESPLRFHEVAVEYNKILLELCRYYSINLVSRWWCSRVGKKKEVRLHALGQNYSTMVFFLIAVRVSTYMYTCIFFNQFIEKVNIVMIVVELYADNTLFQNQGHLKNDLLYCCTCCSKFNVLFKSLLSCRDHSTRLHQGQGHGGKNVHYMPCSASVKGYHHLLRELEHWGYSNKLLCLVVWGLSSAMVW